MFPGPDATIPPGAPRVIPGLGIEALAAAAESQGLVCESGAGAYIGVEAGYELGCEGRDPAAHATFGLTVSYWTLDAVSDIHLYVVSDRPGAVVSPGAPAFLFSRISGLALGDLATTWVQVHLDDQACREGCTQTYGTVHLGLNVGVKGGRQLDIYGYDG